MSSNNTTASTSASTAVSSTIIVLNLIQQRFINYLPLIITVLGIVGFIGNAFTFLQPTLRSNSCCIYTLCGSFIDVINLFINLLPNYFYPAAGNLITGITIVSLCKVKLFGLVFLPQFSMDLLIMSLIDRYACTFGLTSPMRHLLRPKMVPRLIGITAVISCLISFYATILYNVVPGVGCVSSSPTANATLYIFTQGILTPAVMLILVLLTYQRFKNNRQRVVSKCALSSVFLESAPDLLQQGAVVQGNVQRFRNQFIAMVVAQALVTSFFVLQWIVTYFYFLETQYDTKSAEGWAITYFVLALANNLYYLIHVRSFYLSTLTSRLFRNTLIKGVLKLLPGQLHHRWDAREPTVLRTAGARAKTEQTLRGQV